MEKFFNDEELTVPELKAALERVLSKVQLFLVFAVQLTRIRVFRNF